MTNAHDQIYVDQPSVTSRTIFVESGGVRATDFRLEPEVKQGLFDTGANAAHRFLDSWDFDQWRREYLPVLTDVVAAPEPRGRSDGQTARNRADPQLAGMRLPSDGPQSRSRHELRRGP